MRTPNEWTEAKIMFAFLHKIGVSYNNFSIASESDIEILLAEADVHWINTQLSAFRAGQEYKLWLDNQVDPGEPIDPYQPALNWLGKTPPIIKH